MKILIIGESCVDEYVYGTCDRVCPEAAALCFKSNGIINSNLGMAGNVFNNIRAIRPDYQVDIITNINSTIIKRRFIDTRYNSIVFRQDINDRCDRIEIEQHNFKKYNAIIFSDYCKGFLNPVDIHTITKLSDKNCIKFIDTKKTITSFVDGIHFIKINSTEYKDNIHNINNIRLLSDIIVTKGEGGALHISRDSEHDYPTKKIDVRDVCGAGDTFMSSFAVFYLETKDISKSIEYANYCAGKVVSKFGVVTP